MARVEYRTEREGRNILKDVIPLSTPYMFGFFLGDICNFRCKYCIQSAEDEVAEKKFLQRKFMEWDMFVKIVDDLLAFPEKIKKILFTSFGEPLLHPQIVDMVKYLNDRDVANEYEIVTNAAKLNHDMTKKLIDVGLTRLCISLQGLTDKKYKEVCGVELNVDDLFENIKFFYEYGRGKCRLHVKIIDIALDSNNIEKERETFYQLFNGISDTMNIDKIRPSFKGVNYEEMIPACDRIPDEILEKNKDKCCSPLFYTLYCNPNGGIIPCCDNPAPLMYGNVNNESLVNIWNGEKRTKFLIQQLSNQRCENVVCRECFRPAIIEPVEDNLDGYETQLLQRF